MMKEIDIHLIQELRKQSSKAQQMTLERFGNAVFAQVARLIPGLENAEEVYQDVFIKVFKNIKMYDETKSSLKTWISRIAYNESISFLRHKSLPVIYYEDREGEVDKLSDTEVEETFGHPNPETVQLIRAALRHLPPDERAIITMFYYEEMSLKDIAYVTESIPTTVASKLSRTRKKLYKIIKMLQS
ncbi:MAG: sigma-70 family RNA polymerase sigma factor [Prevotella sp.]|jgi:RNA polymerase sigma-70 factor (ECF subfamily)|nr:sigma-70 family RNA polymerase sigma factor [Prevotella sp.]